MGMKQKYFWKLEVLSLFGGLEKKKTQFSSICIWQDPFSRLKEELGYNLEFQQREVRNVVANSAAEVAFS